MSATISSINYCPVKSVSFQSIEKCKIKKDIDLKVREDEQKNKELKDQRRKNRELKLLKEEEQKKRNLEFLRIKEWEEKFDRDKKEKERQENLREQRLRQKELDRIRSLENNEKQADQNIPTSLEDFNIDKTSEN
ncbi:hypothetical protein OAO09_05125 [Candidatus Pelagibacter sp.]|nr:hypothetical protein [Candidatus Pelagibacter sp.]